MSLRDYLDEVLFYKSERSLSFLLGFLVLLLFVVYPFFEVRGIGKYFIDIALSLVLISGTFAVERKRLRLCAVLLAVVTLVTRWVTYAYPSKPLVVTNTIMGAVFLTFATVVILRRVFDRGPVTRYRIEGAIAVYLLIGLVFGMIYSLMEIFQPHSFELSLELASGTDMREQLDLFMGQFNYYSFVTLTTVGYGDVTPISAAAKQLAVLEGLIGQLYPAVLLARLVSMELATSAKNEPL